MSHDHPPRSRSAPARAVSTPKLAAPAASGPPAAESGSTSDERFAMAYGPTSGSVSFVSHLVLILLLAFITSSAAGHNQTATNLVSLPPAPESDQELVEIEDRPVQPLNVQPIDTPPIDASQPIDSVTPGDVGSIDEAAPPEAVPIDPMGQDTAVQERWLERIPGPGGTGENNLRKVREPGARRQNPNYHAPSEQAVAAALKWLAIHQQPDGSWSFDHRGGECQGRCRNHGSLANARVAATGLALLPFLGAGNTHKEGQYKAVVQQGLSYLLTKMKVQAGQSGDLMEPGGTMYSHGIASIALCEAYAMTHDKDLVRPAQFALNHIVAAQDPVGGGWRYQMKQAGDTSVVGWQLMALKSGHMAYLHVPPATIKLASTFLDSVQAESGSQYGYTGPATGRDATTAIGLLCRMYLGWKHDHPALAEGVKYLAERGPSKGNMYYNYYATQVLHHYSGDTWKTWNLAIREQLVTSQGKEGHELALQRTFLIFPFGL